MERAATDYRKKSARAPKMQHDKNDEAPDIGKTNTGAHGRRSDAEHFERHAAWERFFLQKNERHAAWERGRRGGAESHKAPINVSPPHPPGQLNGNPSPAGLSGKIIYAEENPTV